MRELGIDDVALCGLAKRLEEVWLPDNPDPVILPRTSEALYLLQRVRDEAHRFAITYHRQKRSASMTQSLLDGVPGLGETRRKALLRHFGSVKRLRAATSRRSRRCRESGRGQPRRCMRPLRPSSAAATGRRPDDRRDRGAARHADGRGGRLWGEPMTSSPSTPRRARWSSP